MPPDTHPISIIARMLLDLVPVLKDYWFGAHGTMRYIWYYSLCL